MQSEIAIAEIAPGFPAELTDDFHRAPAFAMPPAATRQLARPASEIRCRIDRNRLYFRPTPHLRWRLATRPGDAAATATSSCQLPVRIILWRRSAALNGQGLIQISFSPMLGSRANRFSTPTGGATSCCWLEI